ncbi:MAG: hypothetical protein JWM76_717 [Pseudonocardiales bacterium]|nr:hypothetical protein [Pseudonocardiales bacterium]
MSTLGSIRSRLKLSTLLMAGLSCMAALAVSAGSPTQAMAGVADNVLPTGQTLASGDGLTSMNQDYNLVMQTDGNLVLSADGIGPLWQTATYGHPGSTLHNQVDGNLVVYSADGAPLWWSNQFSTALTGLIVQDDGNLVQYTAAGAVVWFSGTAVPPPPPAITGDRLNGGQVMHAGQRLTSTNADYVWLMQSDGNAVLYENGEAIGATGSAGPGSTFTIQTDGNAVLYDAAGEAAFWTGTDGNPGAYLLMQSDGNLVIYSAAGVALWVG